MVAAWLRRVGVAEDVDASAPWVAACFDLALNEGDTELEPRDAPSAYADWRMFLLLLSRDPASQRFVLQHEGARRLAVLHDLKAEVLGKISRAAFAVSMKRRQGSRERRIDGRIVGGFAGDQPPARPSDEEFAGEALPPKRRER